MGDEYPSKEADLGMQDARFTCRDLQRDLFALFVSGLGSSLESPRKPEKPLRSTPGPAGLNTKQAAAREGTVSEALYPGCLLPFLPQMHRYWWTGYH